MRSIRLMRGWILATLLAAAACATTPIAVQPKAGALESTEAAPRWTPQPGADKALAALWDAKPFALPAATLARASGGTVARMHKREALLFESAVRLTAAGQAVETTHTVWRLLSDEPNQTLAFTWSPWRQEKPKVRARVVSDTGVESWVSQANTVEGTVTRDGLELTDVRQLSIALPNANRGSVIELEMVRTDTRPLVDGGGAMASWDLWSFEPVRRQRYSVEVPTNDTLKIETVGVPTPVAEKHGDSQVVTLDVGELAFQPLALTRSQAIQERPRFTWSTASSWEVVAQHYRPLLDEALSDPVDWSALDSAAGPGKTPAAKIQAVIRWVGDRVRYTALQLGEGAIVPTKPSAVLKRGFGDCKDMSVLVTAALRHYGVKADVALLMAGGTPPRDNGPGLAAFNHMIVAITNKDGSLTWVDPTAPNYPVGVLPAPDRDQRALVLSPATKGLTDTPRRDDTPFVVRETHTLVLAAFGTGRAKVVVEHSGAAEGTARAAVETCDAATAHRLVEGSVRNMFGDAPFTAAVEHCKPGDGPVILTAELDKTDRLDTGDQSATLRLPARILDLVLTDELKGRQPGSDNRTDEKKQDDDRRITDQTGMTEAELERRAFSFENRPILERVYRIILPPRFAMEALPDNRSLTMGPSTWTESFRQVDDGNVEVRFRFEATKADWTVADVEAFRTAFWKRFDDPMLTLSASFEPSKLLREKKAPEAVTLVRQWLTQRPADGPTRARFSRILQQMGLGELAQVESDRARRDAPDDALVMMICADVARHDAFGMLYNAPFDRAKAIACFRGALAKMPDHVWAAAGLADTLRRNVNGEKESKWTADVAEAAGLLQKMVDHKQASQEMQGMLVQLYMATGRYEEVKRLLASEPSLREAKDGAEAAATQVLATGIDGTLRNINRIVDPKARINGLAMAYGALAYMRQYEDATELLAKMPADPALDREIAVLRAMNAGLTRAPDTADMSTPEKAARSAAAVFANASTPTDASQRLARMASPSGKTELDGTPKIFNYVHLPPMSGPYDFDQIYSRGECATVGSVGVFRVRCEFPENRAKSITTYWTTIGGRLALESLGRPSHLAGRAWELANKKKLAEAALWLGWLLDELKRRDVASRSAQLLADYWSQTSHDNAQALHYAAALGMVTFVDMVDDAPASVLETLDKGRADLSGAMRRASEAAYVQVLETRKRYPAAVKVLEPLARSENEPLLWRWLARLEGKSGLATKALERVEAALKKDKENVEWRSEKAWLELHSGKYAEALKTLQELQTEKGHGTSVNNNLIWAHLMAGKLDEETEREALRLADESDADTASLHTAAMVLLERGRVLDAAGYGAHRHIRIEPDMDDAQWLFRGRLLQLLGFTEASQLAYGKIGTDDPELVELRHRYTNERKR